MQKKRVLLFGFAIAVYVILIRGALLSVLFENDLLGWYGSVIEYKNSVTGVNFGTGAHTLEEYRQFLDIHLFQLALLALLIAFGRFVFQRRERITLLAINIALLSMLLFVTEGILSVDAVERRLGLGQFKVLNEEINQRASTELNSLGFRDTERSREDNDRFRIAVLGDSYIWGDGVEDPALIWSHILEQRIQEVQDDSVEVLSWGRNGWSTQRQLRFLENEAQEFEIDYLILGYVANDPWITNVSMPRRLFVWHKIAARLLPIWQNTITVAGEGIDRFVLKIPYFANWGYSGWERALYTPENLAAYREILSRIKRYADDRGIGLLFVSTPNYPPFDRAGYDAVFAVMEDVGIEYLDLYDSVLDSFGHYGVAEIRSQLWANPANSHPGPPLTNLYADRVLDYLIANRVVTAERRAESIDRL